MQDTCTCTLYLNTNMQLLLESSNLHRIWYVVSNISMFNQIQIFNTNKKNLQHSFILSYCGGWMKLFCHLSLDDVTAVNYIIIQPITRIVTKVHGLI